MTVQSLPTKLVRVLARVHSGSAGVEQVVEEYTTLPQNKQLDYQKLLTLARVISAEDVSAAIKIGLKNPEFVANLLVMTGFMDDLAYQASVVVSMLSDGTLNQDDAVVSLDYCLHYKRHAPVKFDDALKELGWQPVQSQLSDADEYAAISDAEFEQTFDSEEGIDYGAGSSELDVSAPEPVPLKKGDGKFTDTIAPEDVRARELASLINKDNKNDGILEKTAKGELGNVVIDSYSRLAESYIESSNYAEAQVVMSAFSFCACKNSVPPTRILSRI